MNEENTEDEFGEDTEQEDLPVLTDIGWHVVETIERMKDLNFSTDDICDALDITDALMYLMLAKGELERAELEMDIRDISG